MNLIDKKIKAGPKNPLVENLLIIEGISRSGKFLLANILNGLEGIEPSQYSPLLEQIPFLYSNGLIEKNTAKELIRCEIDMRCYETLIGRNLNVRPSDKSSIYNIPNHQRFLDRAKDPDGEIALRKFYEQANYSLFILHESLANIRIYFETFPNMKCISLVRNPLALAYSWYKRGLGKRWGTDPLLFEIPFTKTNNKVFPWFAMGWEDLYLKLNEIDRSILSIKSLANMAKKTYKDLPSDIKKRILIVSFENLTQDPESEIKRICNFLNKKALPEMKEILKREKLPIRDQKDKQKETLRKIGNIAKSQHLEELLKLSTNYLKD